MTTLAVADAPLGDAETARLWSASGCRWLTDRDVAVPARLVRRVVGLVDALDRRGAGLADLVPARGLGLLAERAAVMGLPPSGSVSCGTATHLVRSADGWLAVSLPRDDDRQLVPALVEADVEPGTEWDAVELAAITRTDLLERMVMLGLPGARVGEVDDGRAVVVEQRGHAEPRPVQGAVVVDLAALWAGPLCADILARLGARVITVESTQRPDGGRLARRFFAALHGRSESVALDLSTRDGQQTLAGLLRRADVVIEGSRPRALEQMGIRAAELVTSGPAVWVSITAHGRGPDQRDRVGFGDDAAAAGGLVGWSSGRPLFIADAVADPLTGLTAAQAVVELLTGGGRWMVDVALSRVARSVANGWCPPDASTIARPVPRSEPGAPMPLGRDTAAVLRSLGVVADHELPDP